MSIQHIPNNPAHVHHVHRCDNPSCGSVIAVHYDDDIYPDDDFYRCRGESERELCSVCLELDYEEPITTPQSCGCVDTVEG